MASGYRDRRQGRDVAGWIAPKVSGAGQSAAPRTRISSALAGPTAPQMPASPWRCWGPPAFRSSPNPFISSPLAGIIRMLSAGSPSWCRPQTPTMRLISWPASGGRPAGGVASTTSCWQSW